MGEWRNFRREEFACSHCGQNKVEDVLLDALQNLRDACGFPFLVSSGYRCPDHPAEAKKAATGTHTMGLAADIAVSGEQAYQLLRAAMVYGKINGIGINQKGSGRFIHLDIAPAAEGRPRPHVWSY